MKPLPLIDGSLFIDNSSLELLQTCPRAFEYAKIEKRIINKPAPALNFGTAIHLALDVRARGGDYQAQCKVMQEHFDVNPQDEEEKRDINWAVELVKKYNEVYHTEPFNYLKDKEGKVLVELSFALPLFTYEPKTLDLAGVESLSGIPIIYTGRIDLPVSWDGQIYILDHKTASRLGQSYFDEKQMSAQQIGYCWAFQELTGQKVQGFCINAIRTGQIPAKPVGGVEAWWRETLQRQRYNVTPEQITEWKTNTIALVNEFFYHYQNNFFPQKTTWCSGKYGKCQFFGVCSYPKDKRETILASEEYTDNVWSPLKQQKDNT